MKILITGATGTAGSETLNQALLDNEITEVISILRKPSNVSHPKLKTIIHKDFLNYTGLEDTFKNVDACIWCLGISQTQVSKAEYEVITYDYTMNAAKAMLDANPNITFVFLSGMGSDSLEKSRTIFARVKGKTENALQKLGFKKLYSARPGGIIPITPKKAMSGIQTFFLRTMGVLFPKYAIDTVQLAKAMLMLAKLARAAGGKGGDKFIWENKDLKELVNGMQI